MRSLIIFLILIGLSSAISGPAGVVLQGQKADVPSLSLAGINASAFNASEFQNAPLGDPHYIWDRQYVTQNNSPDDSNLINWSNEWQELPQSFSRN